VSGTVSSSNAGCGDAALVIGRAGGIRPSDSKRGTVPPSRTKQSLTGSGLGARPEVPPTQARDMEADHQSCRPVPARKPGTRLDVYVRPGCLMLQIYDDRRLTFLMSWAIMRI
jgi:hypothetical protein